MLYLVYKVNFFIRPVGILYMEVHVLHSTLCVLYSSYLRVANTCGLSWLHVTYAIGLTALYKLLHKDK